MADGPSVGARTAVSRCTALCDRVFRWLDDSVARVAGRSVAVVEPEVVRAATVRASGGARVGVLADRRSAADGDGVERPGGALERAGGVATGGAARGVGTYPAVAPGLRGVERPREVRARLCALAARLRRVLATGVVVEGLGGFQADRAAPVQLGTEGAPRPGPTVPRAAGTSRRTPPRRGCPCGAREPRGRARPGPPGSRAARTPARTRCTPGHRRNGPRGIGRVPVAQSKGSHRSGCLGRARQTPCLSCRSRP